MARTFSVRLLLLATLCAPLAARPPQDSAHGPPPAHQLEARFHELAQLTQPVSGPLGLHASAQATDVYAAMAELAAAGWGPARAWCARHHGDLPEGSRPAPEAVAELFVALVREHGQDPWLLEPAHDPLRSLELAAAPVRAAAGQSLLRAQGLEGPSRALALALRAVALAPRSAPDPAARDRALELLGELFERHPDSPLVRRAHLLAWRIEHLSPGQQVPELVVADVDGNEQRLSLLRGRPILVDFWSLADEDLLSRGAARRALVARHSGSRIAVLAVARDPGAPTTFRRLLEELDLDWPVAFGLPDAGPATWPLDAGPLTVLVDAQGVVRAVGLEGAELDSAVARLLDARHTPEPPELPGHQEHPRTRRGR
jgi:hypothetical protein